MLKRLLSSMSQNSMYNTGGGVKEEGELTLKVANSTQKRIPWAKVAGQFPCH
jgi:hypothetical protein